MTEAGALRQLQEGSQEALGWFIEKYTPYVGTIIHNIIGATMSGADVEEAASDVFFSLWNHAGELKPASVRGWLGSVARNAAKNKLRERGNTLTLEEDILILPGDTPEDAVEERELRRRVQQAVLALEQPDREIFLRFYYYGQSVAEIAQEMGMNGGAVKTRLSRGRARLKTRLADYMRN